MLTSWKCPECEWRQDVDVDDIAEVGIPYCGPCGDDSIAMEPDYPPYPHPSIRLVGSELDGVKTIFIDTETLPEDNAGPILRVYLNDEVIYENPKYPATEDIQHGREGTPTG